MLQSTILMRSHIVGYVMRFSYTPLVPMRVVQLVYLNPSRERWWTRLWRRLTGPWQLADMREIPKPEGAIVESIRVHTLSTLTSRDVDAVQGTPLGSLGHLDMDVPLEAGECLVVTVRAKHPAPSWLTMMVTLSDASAPEASRFA